MPGTAVQSVESQYKNVSLSDLSVVMLGDLTVIQPLYTFGKIAQAARGRGRTACARARPRRA